MPNWVQAIMRINSLRYFMVIVRGIFLRGSGSVDLWREGAALLGIETAVFLWRW